MVPLWSHNSPAAVLLLPVMALAKFRTLYWFKICALINVVACVTVKIHTVSCGGCLSALCLLTQRGFTLTCHPGSMYELEYRETNKQTNRACTNVSGVPVAPAAVDSGLGMRPTNPTNAVYQEALKRNQQSWLLQEPCSQPALVVTRYAVSKGGLGSRDSG